MPNLRSSTIRLAYSNPSLRPLLLPLLKQASDEGSALKSRVQSLLANFNYDAVEDLLKWFQETFSGVVATRAPSGQKQLKKDAEWFLSTLQSTITWGRANERGQSTGVSTPEEFKEHMKKTVGDSWSRLEGKEQDLVRFFAQGDVPTQIVIGSNTYINKIGFDAKKLKTYAESLDKLWQSIKGWRTGALAGGVTVVLAGPKDFRGTAGGTYRSAEDALYVRATPAVMKRSAGTYGSLDYILVHELGHRYERKKSLPTNFDNWTTTRYSSKDGEAFAELFALGHFGLTADAHGSWDPSIQERFEKIMG